MHMDPKRGEIWLINLDPTVGAEIQKTRPCVVVSSDGLRKLPLRLVAPLTEWKIHFANSLCHVQVQPTKQSGLSKESAADLLQMRGVDTKRFVKRLGFLSAELMEEVAAAAAAVVEYQ